MIPLGYYTIPEVLLFIDANINLSGECPELDLLEAGLLDGELSVFVQRGRQYDVEICRIPHEDIQELGRDWGTWIRSGRVPDTPSLSTPDWKAYFEDPLEVPQPKGPRPALERYSLCQFLISTDNLDRWLANVKQLFGPAPEASIPKTGAPGRPTSMGIVMAEFERRRANGGCEASRQAEADALAAWLVKTHPGALTLKAKSIYNKLPPDFRPFKPAKTAPPKIKISGTI